MRPVLQNLAALVATILIAVALATWVSERSALLWLGAVLIAYGLTETLYLGRLYHWTALPRNRSLPVGYGPWRALISRLARFARQEADAQAELAGELERIHAAVDQLPDGLVVLDRYDHVVWANDAAENLHGIFGSRRPIHHFIRHPELERLLDSAESDEPVQCELTTRHGRRFELLVHRTQTGQKLLITRDVTERVQLDAMRSDFVANVSHEIFTPVKTVTESAQRLMAALDDDAPVDRSALRTIIDQSRVMQRLVDDLLTLSSLEDESQGLADDTVDIASLLERLLIEARAISAGRHTIELVLDGPRRVRAAGAELEKAVHNLLTNAIRYTPEGGRITIDWRVQENEGRLSISDTGIGISTDHMVRLSERFYRVDQDRSRATGGTGLGLAIVKHIMARHRGQLRFDSTPGRGSTFTLCLPAARLLADDAPAPDVAGSAPTAPTAQTGSGTAPDASPATRAGESAAGEAPLDGSDASA